MFCFVKGFVGALMVLLIAAIVVPQYSDYVAAAETSEWIHQVAPAKDYVAETAERSRTLVNSGLGAKRPTLSSRAPLYFEVTKDGTIFLQGGSEGQLVVFVPTLTDGKVSWRCIGGSRKATLSCKNSS